MRNPLIWKTYTWIDMYGKEQTGYVRREVQLLRREKEVLEYRGKNQTDYRIGTFKDTGWTIVDGNDYKLPSRKKYENCFVVCLRSTNSKKHGRCIRTTFAVRKAVVK